MAFNERGRGNLKEMFRSKGAETCTRVLVEAIRKEEIRPDEFSLRELWEATKPLEGDIFHSTRMEAIGTGSFATITGELINKKVVMSYDGAKAIWRKLVTVVPGKLKEEKIAGITAQVMPQQIPEGKDYPGSGIDEKYVTCRTYKYGRIAEVTEEMVMFDQTGQVMERAKMIGERASDHKEKLVVEGVQDINGTIYNPAGVATAFYSSTNLNLQQNNAFGASGLSAIEKLAHQMTDDSIEQNYITVDLEGKPALFPVDLMEEARELAKSSEHPETAERSVNTWKGQFEPLTSPWISAQSATTWFWGDFMRDFWILEIWPGVQVLSSRPGGDKEFEADIKLRYKARSYFGLAGVDFRHCFKSEA